ncbi:hypothetical protein ACXHP8_22770 [Vibrio antiquarius]|uniref:hypothetical protein n=1 Tax=Vibrio diabolicus TaxID=50719 RepID=UPI003752D492
MTVKEAIISFGLGVVVTIVTPPLVSMVWGRGEVAELVEKASNEQRDLLGLLIEQSKGQLTNAKRIELLNIYLNELESIPQMKLHIELNKVSQYTSFSKDPTLDEIVKAGLKSCNRSYWGVFLSPASKVLDSKSLDKISESMYMLKSSCEYYYLKEAVSDKSMLNSIAAYKLGIHVNGMDSLYTSDYKSIIMYLSQAISSVKSQINVLEKEI